MFSKLTNRFNEIFAKLKKQGLLTEKHINEAIKSIRIALLEADVALPVVKSLIADITQTAIGQKIFEKITADQMLTKIVHDHLVGVLSLQDGSQNSNKELNGDNAFSKTDEKAAIKFQKHHNLMEQMQPGSILMMVGLQGSGKTTFSGKLAHLCKTQQKKHILLTSLDTYRPAARLQLEKLGKSCGVDTLPILNEDETVIDIAKRSLETFKNGAYDLMIVDTAGRTHIDDKMIQELQQVKELMKPHKTALTVDSMIGQDSANMAIQFNQKIGLDGVLLSKIDGDARGGAALSIVKLVQKPIFYLGVGEKITEIENFDPQALASRILDMGSVIDLVNKAADFTNEKEMEELNAKMQTGQFTLNDYRKQIEQTSKMGGLQGILKYMPNFQKISSSHAGALDIAAKAIAKEKAIIDSMTKKERLDISILKASRKKRIAKGSGVEVRDINSLLKKFRQMKDLFLKMNKDKGKGMMHMLKDMLV